MLTLAAEGLTKTFVRRCGSLSHALDEVSAELCPGEIVVVMGRSGSGKSTLVRTLAGLTEPEKGTVTLGGRPIAEWKKEGRFYAQVQLVFQDALASLNRYRTVGANIEEGARAFGRQGSVIDAARAAGLDESLLGRYPTEISGGQCRRAVLARALAAGPKFLLADELTGGLDLTVQAGILNLLLSLRDEGMGILLVTHDHAAARHLADRVLILDGGRLVKEYRGDEFRACTHP